MRSTKPEPRWLVRLALILSLLLLVAACDTAPDELSLRNATDETLDLFLVTQSGSELMLTALRPTDAYSSLEPCAGPFALRTLDGDFYADIPELCRGDPEYVVPGPSDPP